MLGLQLGGDGACTREEHMRGRGGMLRARGHGARGVWKDQ